MIEHLAKAVEAAKEVVSNKLNDLTPNFLKNQTIGPEKKADDAKIKNDIISSAKIATSFFELNDVPVKEGNQIAVNLKNPLNIKDDELLYNVGQFKKMGCTSLDDMTKIWSHECGHRILQDKGLSTWSKELGADFLAGARSGMLGLPKGNLENMIGSTKASITHPNGALRLKAMEQGRLAVIEMKKKGIKPTWQNCFAEFQKSNLSRMPETRGMTPNSTFFGKGITEMGFIDNRTYHLNKASEYKDKTNYYLKKSEEAAKKGDLKGAKEYSGYADRWKKDSDNALSSANRCSK